MNHSELRTHPFSWCRTGRAFASWGTLFIASTFSAQALAQDDAAPPVESAAAEGPTAEKASPVDSAPADAPQEDAAPKSEGETEESSQDADGAADKAEVVEATDAAKDGAHVEDGASSPAEAEEAQSLQPGSSPSSKKTEEPEAGPEDELSEAALPLEPHPLNTGYKPYSKCFEAYRDLPVKPYCLDAVDYSLPIPDPKVAAYLWPILSTTGVNFTMWGFSKITGAEFADVTPDHWKENFKTGFQWDDNEFEVNQVGHPYQGGLYFATARVNGLSYWWSLPYVMLGSAQWEYFLETESPSTNDWATTTWGGAFFGEALYRLSNRMLDDSTSGSTRFWREFAALAISPINGLSRIISGDAWKSGPQGVKFPLAARFIFGADGIGVSKGTKWGNTFRAKVEFKYGDPYAKARVDIPFEVFDFSAQVNIGKDILGQSFDGTGVLLGGRIRNEYNQHLLAWVIDYEYFTNGTTQMFTRSADGVYQLGEMGTGVGWYGNFRLGSGFSIDTRADVIAVPTGAITSPWAKYEANRNYNYAVGAATKGEISFRHERAGRIYAKSHRYYYSVIDGAKGTELLGLFQAGLYANIYNGHGVGGSFIHYDRDSMYKDYDDIKESFWTAQAQYELEY